MITFILIVIFFMGRSVLVYINGKAALKKNISKFDINFSFSMLTFNLLKWTKKQMFPDIF